MFIFCRRSIICIIAFAFTALFPISASVRELVDMYGKKVVVPDKINRVFSISPSVTYDEEKMKLDRMIANDLLA